MGVVYICQVSTISEDANAIIHFATSYFLVSLSLNIILTLMIVTRLILHRRNLRRAIGVSDSSDGLYTTIVAMLIESYALYVVTFLIYVVPWEAGSPVTLLFCRILGPVQVCAIFAFLRCAAILGHHFLIMATTGHRSVSHHYKSCQPESIHERHDLRGRRFDLFQEPMDDGLLWDPG